MKQTNNIRFNKGGKLYSGVTSPQTDGEVKRVQSFVEESGTLAYTTDGTDYTKVVTAEIMTPINQKAESVHLSPTSAGYVDKLVLSSEPTQVISPNLFDFSKYKDRYNVTVTSNSTQITLTSTSDTQTKFVAYAITLKPNTTYYISFKQSPQDPSAPIKLYDKDITKAIYSFTKDTIFTTLADTEYSLLIYMTLNSVIGTKLITDSPMINEGSTALPFSPYTGQPSPDNVIPINVTTSPIEVISQGRNMFDPERFVKEVNEYSPLAYCLIREVNGQQVLTYRPDGANLFEFMKGEFKENTEYTMQFKIKLSAEATENSPSGFRIDYTDGNYSSIYYSCVLGEDYKQVIFTTEKNKTISYIAIIYYHDQPVDIPINSLQLEEVTTATPYTPYYSNTTLLPLITTSGQTVELLGELNTETDVLVQKYKKIVLDGTVNINYMAPPNSNTVKVSMTVPSKPLYVNVGTVPNIYCEKLPSKNATVWSDVDNISISVYNPNGESNINLRTPLSWGTTSTELKAWFAANPLTVYYEIATPEVLTLTSTPLIPTLAGETNIYANSLSPVTFDITELLTGGERVRAVIRDKEDKVILPFTTAEQVEVDTDIGTTSMDRAVENIQASISDIATGSTPAFNAVNASNANTLGNLYENFKLLAYSLNRFDAVNLQKGTGLTGGAYTPIYAKDIFVAGGYNSGGMAWSTDGKNWNLGKGISSGSFDTPIYAKDIFVTGGYNSGGMAWSTDGKNWNMSNIKSGICRAPSFIKDTFIAGANWGFSKSSDGMNWTRINIDSHIFYSPICAAGVYVAGSSGRNIATSGLLWSLDGDNWEYVQDFVGEWQTPAYVNDIFITGGATGMAWSTDGKNWTLGTYDWGLDPSDCGAPIYANNIYVAAYADGWLWSTEGKNWSLAVVENATDVPVVSPRTPIFANGVFLSGSGYAMYLSKDGKKWTPFQAEGLTDARQIYTPMYHEGVFIAGGAVGMYYILPTTDYGLYKLLKFN